MSFSFRSLVMEAGFCGGNISSYKHRSDTAISQVPLREWPGTMTGRETEMCSIFDVYDKCWQRS